MANEAAPKKRRASGPRTPRPVFAMVSYTDEQGNAISLDKSRLKIVIERDSAKLVELLTSEGSQGATVVKIDLPQPKPRAGAGDATA